MAGGAAGGGMDVEVMHAHARAGETSSAAEADTGAMGKEEWEAFRAISEGNDPSIGFATAKRKPQAPVRGGAEGVR